VAAPPKHKIVVVEDEGLIAADLESRLKTAGYSVTGTADSAPQALKLIRATSPDLVLMDIRLKGDVDGIQVADQVRKELDVPIVYLTAYEDQETLARASQTQAFGYIKKPIASSSLRGSIEMAIAKHQHERDLRAQRDWLAASFSAVPYAVLVTDGSGRIRYVNSQAEELTGWNAEQALGRPSRELLRLFYRESGNPLEDFVPVAMLQGETIPLPEGVWLKGSEGRNYAIEGSVAPRWRDGRIEGAVVALTDTTLRQFEEEQTRQENKQDALVRLADGVARELPQLNRMAEDCARLLEALPGDSGLRQDAEAIQRAATDAFAVTHRLRRFLEPPEVRPAQVLLNEVLSRLEAAWKLIQPNFTMRLEPDPLPVQADEWQLTRSLVSILLHARRRMTETSELAIDMSGAVLEQMSHSARIRVVYTTRDEDAASLERVFEPSWSGDSIDLPVAYRIVKKMGGLIAARLEKGNTVIFDIYLSRVSAAAAGAPIPEPEKPAVLLIEPNPEVRRVLHLHFQRHGYNLLEAEDCEEGLLLANLYPAEIPLIVANPENDDQARADLAEKLTAFRPETRVRVLAGYYESCRAAAGSGMAAIGTRHLTKWDLLAWVQEAFASTSAEDTLA
jgi:two-component system cell cycle sensor histidine kinase/response regulator CckA